MGGGPSLTGHTELPPLQIKSHILVIQDSRSWEEKPWEMVNFDPQNHVLPSDFKKFLLAPDFFHKTFCGSFLPLPPLFWGQISNWPRLKLPLVHPPMVANPVNMSFLDSSWSGVLAHLAASKKSQHTRCDSAAIILPAHLWPKSRKWGSWRQKNGPQGGRWSNKGRKCMEMMYLSELCFPNTK